MTSILQLYRSFTTMSEGKQGRDMAAAVNEGEGEGEGRVAVPPVANESKGEVAVSTTVNEGEEKTGTTPMVDEGRGMDRLSPVMSYEPGIDDQLEPFTSEGETKYRGKGKDRCILRQCNICDSFDMLTFMYS